MIAEAWVHVGLDRPGIESELRARLQPTGRFLVLDGSTIHGLQEFYIAIEQAVPLISGFGRNLNALVDLMRTLGWGELAGESHCLVWRMPDRMMQASPGDFDAVSDVLVGVSKELLVGEELDPTFDPSDRTDWIPTRLDLVFLAESSSRIEALVEKVSRLSQHWADEFQTLDILVNVQHEQGELTDHWP